MNGSWYVANMLCDDHLATIDCNIHRKHKHDYLHSTHDRNPRDSQCNSHWTERPSHIVL